MSGSARQPSEVELSTVQPSDAPDAASSIAPDDVEEVKAFGREFFIYLVFLSIFTAITVLARGNQNAFYTTDMMKSSMFTKEIDDGRTFWEVASVGDIWAFIEGPYLNFLLQDVYDDGSPSPVNVPQSERYYANLHNKVLGGVRVRQLRVKENSCTIDGDYEGVITQCYDSYSEGDEQEEDFTAGGEEYLWLSASQTDEPRWVGTFAWYAGSGFTEDLPLDRTQALDKVSELRSNRWIRNGTRAVILDFNTYNPGVNLHATCRLAFEIPSSGGVLPKADCVAMKLNRYYGTSGQAQLGLEIVFLVFLLYYIGVEVYEMVKGGSCREYWSDGWNVIDWLNIVLFIASIGVRATAISEFSEVDPVKDTMYQPMRTAVNLFLAESYISAVNAFILWLKMFKFFTFSARIMFLWRTFQQASTDLFFFLILFVIFFVGFAHAGYMAFSGNTMEFRSFSASVMTLFRALTGDMDYETLNESNRVFGPLYFLVFQLFVLLILINVFLAILTDAYTAVREQEEENGEDAGHFAELFSRMKNKVMGGFKTIGHLVSKTRDEHMDMADIDGDGKVSEGELQKTFDDVGYRGSAYDAVQRFDADGDGQLDEAEMAALKASMNQEAAFGQVVELNERLERLERTLQELVAQGKKG